MEYTFHNGRLSVFKKIFFNILPVELETVANEFTLLFQLSIDHYITRFKRKPVKRIPELKFPHSQATKRGYCLWSLIYFGSLNESVSETRQIAWMKLN